MVAQKNQALDSFEFDHRNVTFCFFCESDFAFITLRKLTRSRFPSIVASNMARPGVILPILQNWSCHNCGGCCREHQIVITADEKKRIDKQKWTAADGVAVDQPLIVPHGRDFRLNHQTDGACIFLDDQGLCRIHAKFGEAAKPLACRAYPYAVHPSGNSVTVSLRFSCPSVVQNLGQPVAQQRQSLEKTCGRNCPVKL